MPSIRPEPNKGVGMRKLRFLVSVKSGFSTAQVKASERPFTVNSGSTSPAATPVFQRTARTGPSAFKKSGMLLRAP